MLAQDYWNEIGAKKDFEDPIYFERLQSYLSLNSRIIEYGCGYGRMMKMFQEKGYTNLVGFDFAPAMIERGRKTKPGA